MVNLSEEEVRERNIKAMAHPLGEFYSELSKEVAWLHLKWKDLRDLYFADQKTKDLLRDAAPEFFFNLNRMMWEDVLLHLCRLTDRGKNKLTVTRLGNLIPDGDLKKKVLLLARDAKTKTKFARDWRNRRIAHREIHGDVPGLPLAHRSTEKVEAALDAIRQTLSPVEKSYLNTTIAYKHSIEALGGVASLVSIMKLGVEARKSGPYTTI